jgi:CheY-like chemotaxis protein
MKKLKGKLVLIDDEKFEKKLLSIALKELNIHLPIEYFHDPEEALRYLKKTEDDIFLIISDINMPKMNGLELKKAIDKDRSTSKKALPFIFSSTSATKHQIEEAYEYRLQGYFLKPHDLKAMAKQLETIINYWKISLHPNCNYFE